MWMFLCQCSCAFPHITSSCSMWSSFHLSVCPLLSVERHNWIQFWILQAGCLYYNWVFPFLSFFKQKIKKTNFELALLLLFHPRPWESGPKVVRSSVRKHWDKSKVLLSPGTEAFQQIWGYWWNSTSDCHNPSSHQRTASFSFLEEYSKNIHIPQLSCLPDDLYQKTFWVNTVC